MIPAAKRGSWPLATSGRRLKASVARRSPRSTALTTSGIVKPGCTWSCGAKRTSR